MVHLAPSSPLFPRASFSVRLAALAVAVAAPACAMPAGTDAAEVHPTDNAVTPQTFVVAGKSLDCAPEVSTSGGVEEVCQNPDDTGPTDPAEAPEPGGSGSFVSNIPTSTSPVIYRLVQTSTGDHLYTTSRNEAVSAVVNSGFYYEGLAGVCAGGGPGTEPLYRLFKNWASLADHFYTTSYSEAASAYQNASYAWEGVMCSVYTTQVAGTCPFYRLNVAGHHFYTASWNELWMTYEHGGSYEGVTGYVFPYGPVSGNGCPR